MMRICECCMPNLQIANSQLAYLQQFVIFFDSHNIYGR